MPRGFTEEESRKIREQLILLGNERFSTLGLKKTSIEELAEEAGIAKGSFYRFFPSKEALYFTCLELQEKAFRRDRLTPLLESPKPRQDLLEELIRLLYHLPEEYPLMTILLRPKEYEALQRGLPRDMMEEHRQSDEDAMGMILATLTGSSEAGTSEGAVDPAALNGLFWALLLLNLHRPELGEVFEPATELLAKTVSRGLEMLLSQEEDQ